MQNLVKLVQANGKALLLPAHDISIIRELEPQEKEKHANGATAIWVMLNGMAQSAVVRERFGYIVKKAGGASSDRVQLRGLNETRISMPRTAFAHAIEGERADDIGGEKVKTDVTIVNTTLRGGGGVVAFHAADSAADIFDMLSTEESDDHGDDEGGEEPDAKPVAASPRKPRRAARSA